MKKVTKDAEYTMARTEDSFTFSVKEERDFSAVKIEHISEAGANLFFNEISRFDVRACQLVSLAEDKAIEAVSEILLELL